MREFCPSPAPSRRLARCCFLLCFSAVWQKLIFDFIIINIYTYNHPIYFPYNEHNSAACVAFSNITIIIYSRVMTLLNGYNARAKWRGKNGDGERRKKRNTVFGVRWWKWRRQWRRHQSNVEPSGKRKKKSQQEIPSSSSAHVVLFFLAAFSSISLSPPPTHRLTLFEPVATQTLLYTQFLIILQGEEAFLSVANIRCSMPTQYIRCHYPEYHQHTHTANDKDEETHHLRLCHGSINVLPDIDCVCVHNVRLHRESGKKK